MEQFPHLKFVRKISGKPKFPVNPSGSPISDENRGDRQGHSSKLQRWVTSVKEEWDSSLEDREINGFAPLENNVKQIFLRINPAILNPDFNLEKFGIEIISEEEDGFILGASLDNFQTLEEKIGGFINSVRETGKIADFWQIIEGNREDWKPKHILSEELFTKWSTIDDNATYNLEVSVAFDKSIRAIPDRTKRGGEARYQNYLRELEEREELLDERIGHFKTFIDFYGEITSSIVHLEDSFGCEVLISGKGLKDLTLTYPFVFEIVEIEDLVSLSDGDENTEESEFNILSPESGSIEVGIIDSGIMEGNRFISPSIISENSRSYLDDSTSTADHVGRGGHGTKVAGAALYPKGVAAIDGAYQLPFFVRNLRVLDANNKMPHKFPSELMQRIVNDNSDCSIFNLSINSEAPFRLKHMSNWSSTIDTLSHEKNVLFLISSGNIYFDDVRYYLNNGFQYPNYLFEPFCRIANPGQSSFGITVGSINHCDFDDSVWKSLGGALDISGYSRIGSGIWGHIKPDVVEFGGGIVSSSNGILRVKEHSETATELIRSTLNGGNAVGKDSVGTSYATPKVTHIAARLKQLYEDENMNLIRAFVVQGARLPGDSFKSPTRDNLRFFGYGIPDIDRVTKNTEHRITFYNTGLIKAEQGDVYSLSLPEAIRGQGDDYDILIEVTLAYSGKVRRTRQKTKSYLSTWLDWTSSKMDESFDDFSRRVVVFDEDDLSAVEADSTDVIPWMIRERSNWGQVRDFNRNNSTLQKDWAIVKSYQLPEEMCFAIRGHKGWDKSKVPIPYAFTVSIEILGANIPIYELIRVENEIEIEQEISSQT